MDYKKKYEEALERAKYLKENTDGVGALDVSRCFEEIFPELKENEDERIRKELIKYLKERLHSGFNQEVRICNDGIAWLEKQGEQKQHLELKAGHWYICHQAYCCRADHLTVKEGERFMCEKDGVVKGFIIKEPEKYFTEVTAPLSEPLKDEQKPVWSEEDKEMLLDAIHWINEFQKSNRCKNENDMQNSVTCQFWLKSLQERMKGE